MGINNPEKSNILTFVHIPKAAGSTITYLLRSIYGIQHCRAFSVKEIYTKKDMEFDVKLYPFLKSISGHQLRPHVDFGSFEDKLIWFVMLREPIERFYSQYRWWCKQNNSSISFKDWCDKKGEKFSNFQVRWIAGDRDVEKAKKILLEKFDVVGDQADVNKSLQILSTRLNDNRFPEVMHQKINKAKNKIGEVDEELASTYNQLDIELYAFFRNNIWTPQLQSSSLSKKEFRITFQNRINRLLNLAYHKGIYTPIKKLRGRIV